MITATRSPSAVAMRLPLTGGPGRADHACVQFGESGSEQTGEQQGRRPQPEQAGLVPGRSVDGNEAMRTRRDLDPDEARRDYERPRVASVNGDAPVRMVGRLDGDGRGVGALYLQVEPAGQDLLLRDMPAVGASRAGRVERSLVG